MSSQPRPPQHECVCRGDPHAAIDRVHGQERIIYSTVGDAADVKDAGQNVRPNIISPRGGKQPVQFFIQVAKLLVQVSEFVFYSIDAPIEWGLPIDLQLQTR